MRKNILSNLQMNALSQAASWLSLAASLAKVIKNIEKLDISNNIALGKISCYGNNLTSLDVSKNAVLTGLECDDDVIIGW